MELFGRELSLEQMIGLVECQATPDEDLVHRAALEIITALRESQRREREREKGCEYCLQGEDLAYGYDSMQRTGRIYIDGNLLTADLYSESMAVVICFCPVCGKRLEVEHGE